MRKIRGGNPVEFINGRFDDRFTIGNFEFLVIAQEKGDNVRILPQMNYGEIGSESDPAALKVRHAMEEALDKLREQGFIVVDHAQGNPHLGPLYNIDISGGRSQQARAEAVSTELTKLSENLSLAVKPFSDFQLDLALSDTHKDRVNIILKRAGLDDRVAFNWNGHPMARFENVKLAEALREALLLSADRKNPIIDLPQHGLIDQVLEIAHAVQEKRGDGGNGINEALFSLQGAGSPNPVNTVLPTYQAGKVVVAAHVKAKDAPGPAAKQVIYSEAARDLIRIRESVDPQSHAR